MLSTSGFLFFHAVAEIFAMTISFGVFFIAWNTRKVAGSSFFVIIGPAFALVGATDVLHTLTYKGMGTYAGGSADLPTQLWVAARATEVVAVMTGVLLAGRPIRADGPAVATAMAGCGLYASIWVWPLFPTCYVDGVGMTPFKVTAEYVFVAAKLATGAMLWLQRAHFDVIAARWLGAYLAVSALSELAFTSYVGVYDGMNQLGHVLKVLGFLAIYQATVKAVLQRPYSALFRSLQAARDALEDTVAARTRELAEANDLLTTLVESAPLAIFANDTKGRVILWNSGAQRLFGWTAEEALGRPLLTADDDHKTEQQRLVRQVLDGTPLLGTELDRRRKDGSPVTVRDYAAPIRDADGTIRGVVSLVVDITAERAAERAVRRGEERLSGLMANVPDAILTVTEDGIVDSCNAAAERLFGYTPAELVGAPAERLLPAMAGTDGDGAAGVGRLVGHGSREVMARCRDGRELPVELAFNAMQVDGRRLFVGVLRDISERLRGRLQREAMERALMRAQKMEALGSLAGGIAHEVNNMLTPILGLTEVALLRLPADSPLRPNLERVVEAAQRARDILRKVLAFSRADTAPPEPLALRGLLQEALPLVRAALPMEVRLDCSLPEDDLVARCARTEFQQIMMNLCANAGHAMSGKGGRIDIRLAPETLDGAAALALGLPTGGYAVLSVADDGAGMDAATMEKIFEPFFTTKPVGEGTGMGLSVVHAIIVGWRGTITVESAAGNGAVFRIYLPLAAEPAMA